MLRQEFSTSPCFILPLILSRTKMTGLLCDPTLQYLLVECEDCYPDYRVH